MGIFISLYIPKLKKDFHEYDKNVFWALERTAPEVYATEKYEHGDVYCDYQTHMINMIKELEKMANK